MTKAELRETMLVRREALSAEHVREVSRRIQECVLELDAESWFVYVSTGHEVQTHGLIRELLRRGRRVAAPWVIGRGVMEAHRIASFEELQPGRFGILAPTVQRLEPEPDLCLVPCVAVTERGDRLGRGGAYYDRYLAGHRDMHAVALAFDEQLVESIPVVPHDTRVHTIITPTHLIHC